MRLAALVLALCLAGCSGFLQALTAASQGAQWLGDIVEVADAGADAYFARHPSLERERTVDAAVLRSRRAVAALDAALAGARSLDSGDVSAARVEALRAYYELRIMLDEFGVLGAVPPPGGAESDAPPPAPLDLPMAAEVATRLGG